MVLISSRKYLLFSPLRPTLKLGRQTEWRSDNVTILLLKLFSQGIMGFDQSSQKKLHAENLPFRVLATEVWICKIKFLHSTLNLLVLAVSNKCKINVYYETMWNFTLHLSSRRKRNSNLKAYAHSYNNSHDWKMITSRHFSVSAAAQFSIFIVTLNLSLRFELVVNKLLAFMIILAFMNMVWLFSVSAAAAATEGIWVRGLYIYKVRSRWPFQVKGHGVLL